MDWSVGCMNNHAILLEMHYQINILRDFVQEALMSMDGRELPSYEIYAKFGSNGTFAQLHAAGTFQPAAVTLAGAVLGPGPAWFDTVKWMPFERHPP